MGRLSSALIVVGVLVATLGAAWQLGLVPGSRTTLPLPVAAAHSTATSVPPSATATAAPTASAPAAAAPAATAGIAPTVQVSAKPLPLAPADAAERASSPPEPGYAVRLAIPAIKLETEVEQAGIITDATGNSSWQTRPFVAVHYGQDTSLLGVPGNAVIAGHVVTLNEGNVFRFLYRLELDDEIAVWDQRDREHDYHVVDVKLVPPTETSVMEPTPDETLTLITCGGTFDQRTRQFSDRLIVIAKPI